MSDLRSGIAASVLGAVFAAGAFEAAGAAVQPVTVEELTVTGREPPKGRPETISYAVTFHDLDLKTQQGRDVLSQRVDLTAGYVCDRLAVDDPSLSRPECKARAVIDANAQVRKAIHLARAHGKHWDPGPAWVPPTAHR